MADYTSTENREVLNTDVYNIAETVNNLAKTYIPEMSDDTLSVGLPGFIISLETMKLKNNAIMTGALANEVFPQRALLDRNIITHAIMQGVTGINAVPAHMTVIIGILETDFLKYAKTNSDNSIYEFTFDKFCPLNIENKYDFYLDYNLILKRGISSTGSYVYTATYDLPTNKYAYNRISTIDNPYAKQPYIAKVGEDNFIFLQVTLHQISIERKYTTLITSNVIDNRTIVFEFNEEQQLADFEVIVTEPNSTTQVYLTPVFEGAALDSDADKYCEYTYINTNTIRISFVRASYMPSINSQVEINIKTTLGSEGIFEYNTATFVNYASETFGYPSGINLYIRPNTGSSGGVDRKSIEELHNILPKQILMNGAITTETDLTNYFNLINTDTEKMIMMKKSDSQIERIYYAYMLIKNSLGNVVPTNTITIDIPDDELPIITEDGNYVLPAGSIIIYDSEKRVGTITHNPEEAVKTSNYVYMMIYTTEIILDPLYASFFMTTIDQSPYATYSWINTSASVQFMIETFHFQRSMLENTNKYFLDFTAVQNINAPEDMYIVEVDPETGEEIVTNNMKCFIVLYQNGIPYRYTEGTLVEADLTYYKFDWRFTFETSNQFDTANKLMINGMYVANTHSKLYGYFTPNVEAYVYILAKSEYIGTDNRYDLDTVISDGSGTPVLDGYGITNKFEIHGGLNFFVDYSSILNSTITVRENPDMAASNIYNLQGIPVIGYQYVTDVDTGSMFFQEFLNAMDEKKAYMDSAMVLLENSFEIDYKFYNTYGPSLLYTIAELNYDGIVEDEEDLDALIVTDPYTGEIISPAAGTVYLVRRSQYGPNIEFVFTGYIWQISSAVDIKSIGRIDINLEFTLSLKSSSDIYTKDNIIKYIKNYIENLNITNEDLDISNMMSDVKVKFASTINYIDYNGFNLFDSNTQHLYWRDPSNITIPPEFINVRTTKDDAGNIIPDITINVV